MKEPKNKIHDSFIIETYCAFCGYQLIGDEEKYGSAHKCDFGK